MKQKYKIYINESPVWILPRSGKEADLELPKSLLRTTYRGKKKMLLNYIDLLEKSKKHDGIILQADDVQAAYRDFKSLFTYIKAGGGVVRNKNNEILIMYRLGYWDLPKGKMDPGETIRETAIREVTEEVGLHDLEVEGKICDTFHSYRTKSKRVLKKTNWYAMYAPNPNELALEYAENIEDAVWVDPQAFDTLKLKTYKSVKDTIEKYNLKFTKVT